MLGANGLLLVPDFSLIALSSVVDPLRLANAALEHASEACRHRFDRAFLRILVERLSLANQRLTGV